MAISEKKKASNRRWDDANRERVKYLNKKSTAKNFIKIAELNDIEILKECIKEREYDLKNENNTDTVWLLFSSSRAYSWYTWSYATKDCIR